MTLQYANAPVFLGATNFQPGSTVPVTGGVAIQKPNGKYLSVQPDGSYQERDAVGPWETFTVDGAVNVLHVNPGVPYSIAYRGV